MAKPKGRRKGRRPGNTTAAQAASQLGRRAGNAQFLREARAAGAGRGLNSRAARRAALKNSVAQRRRRAG